MSGVLVDVSSVIKCLLVLEKSTEPSKDKLLQHKKKRSNTENPTGC